MSDDVHKKAETLIAASRVEGISKADGDWLASHLEECAECTARAESVEQGCV